MGAFQFCGAPRKSLKLVSALRFCSDSLKKLKEKVKDGGREDYFNGLPDRFYFGMGK